MQSLMQLPRWVTANSDKDSLLYKLGTIGLLGPLDWLKQNSSFIHSVGSRPVWETKLVLSFSDSSRKEKKVTVTCADSHVVAKTYGIQSVDTYQSALHLNVPCQYFSSTEGYTFNNIDLVENTVTAVANVITLTALFVTYPPDPDTIYLIKGADDLFWREVTVFDDLIESERTGSYLLRYRTTIIQTKFLDGTYSINVDGTAIVPEKKVVSNFWDELGEHFGIKRYKDQTNTDLRKIIQYYTNSTRPELKIESNLGTSKGFLWNTYPTRTYTFVTDIYSIGFKRLNLWDSALTNTTKVGSVYYSKYYFGYWEDEFNDFQLLTETSTINITNKKTLLNNYELVKSGNLVTSISAKNAYPTSYFGIVGTNVLIELSLTKRPSFWGKKTKTNYNFTSL